MANQPGAAGKPTWPTHRSARPGASSHHSSVRTSGCCAQNPATILMITPFLNAGVPAIRAAPAYPARKVRTNCNAAPLADIILQPAFVHARPKGLSASTACVRPRSKGCSNAPRLRSVSPLARWPKGFPDVLDQPSRQSQWATIACDRRSKYCQTDLRGQDTVTEKPSAFAL